MMLIGALLLPILATKINGEMLFPRNTQWDLDESPRKVKARDIVVKFGSQSSGTLENWHLSTDESDGAVAPDDWAVEATLKGRYQFTDLHGPVSSVAVTVDGACTTTKQCDMFWGFGSGDKFITFGHDFDGGMLVNHFNGVNNGLFIYPPCGGPMATGDVSTLLADYDVSEADNWWKGQRDALTQGDRTKWTVLSQLHNEDTWPVTVEVTNDLDANQTTFRFVSDTVDVSCVYEDVFDTDTQLKVAFSPDISEEGEDEMDIYSISVDHSLVSACAALKEENRGPNWSSGNWSSGKSSSSRQDFGGNWSSGNWSSGQGFGGQGFDEVYVKITGKELVIVGLLAANIALCMIVTAMCKKNGSTKTGYKVVSVDTEAEMERIH